MARYNTSDETDLVQQIADLKRRISVLEAANRAGATSIDKGTLVARHTNGNAVFEAGFVSPTTDGWGFAARRADGGLAWFVYSEEDGDGFWAGLDKQGNILISEDGASGQGLALPYLPFVWETGVSVPSGTETTTSGSFTSSHTAVYLKQHPKVIVMALVRSSDGSTTGEIRLLNTTMGEQIGTTQSIVAGEFSFKIIDGPISGTHLQSMQLDLQIRRTAGAGTIGARPYLSYGRQT